MKLSIIVPIYNVEEYLPDCLNSLVSQDIKDYEIICIEDKSTDNSAKILNEYAHKYNNIKAIYHNHNRGLSAARNTGIKHAQGKYIQFVDSDDMIKPNVCDKIYKFATKKKADVVFFNMFFLNNEAEGLCREQQKYTSFSEVYSGRQLLCEFQEMNISKPEAVRQFLRREFLIDNNLVFYEGIIHEDILFYFMVMMKAKIAIDINEEYYIYRQRRESISWGQRENSASSLMVCMINICSYWMTNSFSTEENMYIYEFVKSIYISYLNRKKYQDSEKLQGKEKEILIQKIMSTMNNQKVSFKDKDIERLEKAKNIIIYGAGKVAKDVLYALEEMKIHVSYMAITETVSNEGVLNGIPIKSISELKDYRGSLIVMGTSKRFYGEIISTLNEYQFKEIIYPIV